MPFPTLNAPHVESVLRVELFLNVVWGLLTALMVILWLRLAPRNGPSRRMQFVALAVLVLILFPVISVTDDLQAALNPAETDTCLRRSLGLTASHSIVPVISVLPVSNIAQISLAVLKTRVEASFPTLLFDNPAQAPIQNRPPPIA